jgi:AAA+ ATPase superfamily predicted ATPase
VEVIYVVELAKVQAPSIHPNPDYYIEREDEVKKIKDFIEKTEGAVIGLTGVRGSGKTTIMEKVIKKYKDDYFTLKISSPTGYDEKEFFIMVFRRICEEVNKRIEEKFRMRTSIEELAKRKSMKYLILFLLFYIIPIIFVSLITFYPFSIGLLSLSSFFSSSSLLARLFIGYIIAIPAGFLAMKFLREFRKMRRFPKMLGLHLATQDILETLKYERTISYHTEAEAGITKHITAFFKMGKELKTRPFTLPGLTSEYNDYVSNVIDVFGGKAIICIDELDKIADPEEVKKLLRGIKGAIFQKNCYYLISISEDAVRSFRTRISAERDMLESTFDEMINLDRIDLNIARKIAKQWLCQEEKEELSQEARRTIDIMGVLSGGVPRELIRNLREVSMVLENAIVPMEAWKILFRKKMCDLSMMLSPY